MRIEYKEDIFTKIHKLYHELQLVNKFHLVEAIYLDNREWDEFRNGLNYNYTMPKSVAIHTPIRIDYTTYDVVPSNTTHYTTEEILYHGFKVRREYK